MAKSKTMVLEVFIGKEKEGLYFDVPFEVPEGVEEIGVRYQYERYRSVACEGITKTQEINIIDLAISSEKAGFIGSSGSDRSYIKISEHNSSDGFACVEPEAGTWNIIVGAYKVQPQGVCVTYQIEFKIKERILLKGDCHLHTTGSDGVLSIEELSSVAQKSGLDFIFVTDHNNYSHNFNLRSSEKLTVLPGVEWTHFKGHMNMLGVERPFCGKYYANSLEEVRKLLDEARSNGALLSVNHPFDASCPWKWGLDEVSFDCLELWNGIVKQSDMQCIQWWHNELCKGRRLPAIGGSDFHKFSNFITPGRPTTCVYSMSRGKSDILRAIREGHAYIAYQPDAPAADIRCKNAVMGDEIPFENGMEIMFEFSSLKTGDIIRVYSAAGVELEENAAHPGSLSFSVKAQSRRFYRAEIYRRLLPQFPPMLCVVTNPLYIQSGG